FRLRMDPLEYLPVRFHFGGDFINNGRETFYIGGSEGMSYIERDKVSLPEIVGHLKDHCEVIPGMLLQWLFPSKELADGLRVLIDAEVCNYMSNCVGEGGVADIYVETVMAEESSESGSKDDSDFEDELQDISPADDEWDDEEDEDLFELNTGKEVLVIVSTPEKTKRDLEQVRAFRTPDKEKAMVVAEPSDKGKAVVVGKERLKKPVISDSDSDYVGGDSCSSEEDEEVQQIRKAYKEFKKKLKDDEVGNLDDVICEGSSRQTNSRALVQIEGDDGASPYDNSSADDDSYEEDSDGQLKEFKEAVVQLALDSKRFIRFIKDEGYRTRAKCDWATCPWACLLSKNSRTESWQIASLVDEHTCPPRKDNHLVTYKRIAQKYEKMITDNPTWSIQSMQSTVSEEMFANVSVGQCKRAKAFVFRKIYESTRGEYSRIFDYQLELLRSNPGSTVVVKLDTDQPSPIFKRIYICLAACKQGFLAGYTKVVQPDAPPAVTSALISLYFHFTILFCTAI
uniref:Uncharacterized protein n=1 Tax=Oryza glaberrima TaxID=4538 RepID=I1PW73_ORYGL